jgi:hypothetical protein
MSEEAGGEFVGSRSELTALLDFVEKIARANCKLIGSFRLTSNGMWAKRHDMDTSASAPLRMASATS